MTSRNWCFTLNNPRGQINVDLESSPNVRYAVYQLEMGEEGTTHYQGYVEFSKPQRLSAMKKLLVGAHFESRRGTREQAREYCMKEDTRIEGPYEIGSFEAGGQGARIDVIKLKDDLKKGDTDVQLFENHTAAYLRYYRAIGHIRHIITPPRNTKTIVTYIYGPPGTGKSYMAWQLHPNAYPKQRSQWWCGYTSGQSVILDEYYGWLPWGSLLQLMDEYPLTVETKGGQAQFTAPEIIITSNKLPEQWYDQSYPIAALIRRIDRYKYKFELQTEAQTFEDYPTFKQAVHDREYM